ncbi:MAG: S41 family peptidase [Sphingopyxis sp.]|uniref:S41 family peptidase n=1 Tax=Sphingopyxis sp. TaxID=1908224 RepID=UPI002ABA8C9E|nr:S41 family peptidase [Sphingopyxis sp.]MDZ3833763.1 S41 family peptidase [Sphingopyxis sp.]
MRRPSMMSLFFAAPLLLATAAAANETALTAADRQQIVAQLGETLKANYVFQEKAEAIAATLRRNLDAGNYDAAQDKAALARKLTDDLLAESHDLHFFVGVDRAFADNYRERQDPARAAAIRIEERRAAEKDNFGFAGLQRLDGNIAYVRLSHFADPDLGYDTAAAAMRFIENSDAVIYDLRYNNGGVMEMAQLLASQLFAGNKDQELFDYYYYQDGNRIERGQWVLPAVPAKRLTDKPVYVLTGSTTFSAAEWFAFTLQKLKRATLIGERTAGGAHPVDRKPFATDFFVQVPIGQIHDPVDHSDFEAKGVMPDHMVASADALRFAYRLALADRAKADPAKQADADWLEPLIAAGAPKSLQPSDLKAIAGSYDGRKIEIIDGGLSYVWRQRFRLALAPLGNDLFAVEGVDEFRFRIARKAGKVVALERLNRDGTIQSYARQ